MKTKFLLWMIFSVLISPSIGFCQRQDPTWGVQYAEIFTTPSATYTSTHTFTNTRTFTPTHTFTFTETFVDTATFTPTPTFTDTSTWTSTDTFTETHTFTATNTFTATDTPPGYPGPFTPADTSTDTYTETPTYTDTPTYTNTPTRTETHTHTATDTHTLTWTYTDTPTHTHTRTYTPTATSTSTDVWDPERYYPRSEMYTSQIYMQDQGIGGLKIIPVGGPGECSIYLDSFTCATGGGVTIYGMQDDETKTFSILRFPSVGSNGRIHFYNPSFPRIAISTNGVTVSGGSHPGYLKGTVNWGGRNNAMQYDCTGAGWRPRNAPSTFKYANIAATTPGPVTVYSPTGDGKAIILQWRIVFSGDAAVSTAGPVSAIIYDGGSATGLVWSAWLPSTPATTVGNWSDSGWVDLGTQGWKSSTANNAFSVSLSAPLSVGNCRVYLGCQSNYYP